MTSIFIYLFALARAPLQGRLLDVGCGEGLLHDMLKGRSRGADAVEVIGVDIYLPYLRRARNRRREVVQAHAAHLPFRDKTFDGVISLEVIEHLSKEEGYQMLEELERICRGRIIVSTPKKFEEQGAGSPNPFELHRSAWTPKEFRKRGYKVRYLPKKIGLLIPFYIVYRFGILAQHIFAIKEMDSSLTKPYNTRTEQASTQAS